MIFNFPLGEDIISLTKVIISGVIIFVFEGLQYTKNDKYFVLKFGWITRLVFYIIAFYSFIFFGNFNVNEFIYFQF